MLVYKGVDDEELVTAIAVHATVAKALPHRLAHLCKNVIAVVLAVGSVEHAEVVKVAQDDEDLFALIFLVVVVTKERVVAADAGKLVPFVDGAGCTCLLYGVVSPLIQCVSPPYV